MSSNQVTVKYEKKQKVRFQGKPTWEYLVFLKRCKIRTRGKFDSVGASLREDKIPKCSVEQIRLIRHRDFSMYNNCFFENWYQRSRDRDFQVSKRALSLAQHTYMFWALCMHQRALFSSPRLNTTWHGGTCAEYTAAHCSTLHDTARHCNTLHHAATHYNTLQHIATHCSTLLVSPD